MWKWNFLLPCHYQIHFYCHTEQKSSKMSKNDVTFYGFLLQTEMKKEWMINWCFKYLNFAPKICFLRFAMKWLSYNIEILDVAISYLKVAWGLLYTLQISHLGTWDRNRDKKCCSFLSWHHHQMLQSHIFCLDALGQQLKNMLKKTLTVKNSLTENWFALKLS